MNTRAFTLKPFWREHILLRKKCMSKMKKKYPNRDEPELGDYFYSWHYDLPDILENMI